MNDAPMRAFAMVAGIVCAIAARWLAVTTYMEVSMAGFPNGHVTAFGKAVDVP